MNARKIFSKDEALRGPAISANIPEEAYQAEKDDVDEEEDAEDDFSSGEVRILSFFSLHAILTLSLTGTQHTHQIEWSRGCDFTWRR